MRSRMHTDALKSCLRLNGVTPSTYGTSELWFVFYFFANKLSINHARSGMYIKAPPFSPAKIQMEKDTPPALTWQKLSGYWDHPP